MIKLSRRIITSICLLGATYASAQTTFYVGGLGRAQITNDQLSGSVLDSDTVGGVNSLERKNTGGYTLLDLDLNVEKKEKFFLNATLRGRDNFGLFWGEGTSFEFRKITMGGIIGSGIKYEIGDIYVEMSPYTVYMPEVGFNEYESDIFKERREIVEYENFIQGNSRFLQGAKSSGTLLFTQGIEKLHIAGFATRTSKISQVGNPDVIMAGLSTMAEQGKFGNFGLNFVSLFDLPVSTNTEKIVSSVLTVQLQPEYKISDDITVGIDAEIGGSNYYSQDLAISDVEIGFSDIMYDVMAKAELKQYKTSIGVGYKSVGADFRSPGAQSRRINSSQTTQIFPTNMVDVSGAQVVRQVLLFDRFTQENMYRQGVNYRLDGYNPAFNNITPYGDATPNRKGIVAEVKRGTDKDVFSLDLGLKLFSEETPDITANTSSREFMALTSGLFVNLGKAIDSKKDIIVGGGYRMESTSRGGDATVDLNSSVIDVVLSVEAVKDFDVMLGYKNYKVEGNEFLWHIDRYNYTKVLDGEAKYNLSEALLSVGARYRFTEKAALTLNYNIVSSSNDFTAVNDDYGMKQLFMNYTMKF